MFLPGGGAYVEAANQFLRDQMIFGTSYPGRPLVQTVDAAALPLNPVAREKFMSGNAVKLLVSNELRFQDNEAQDA